MAFEGTRTAQLGVVGVGPQLPLTCIYVSRGNRWGKRVWGLDVALCGDPS